MVMLFSSGADCLRMWWVLICRSYFCIVWIGDGVPLVALCAANPCRLPILCGNGFLPSFKQSILELEKERLHLLCNTLNCYSQHLSSLAQNLIAVCNIRIFHLQWLESSFLKRNCFQFKNVVFQNELVQFQFIQMNLLVHKKFVLGIHFFSIQNVTSQYAEPKSKSKSEATHK